MATTPKTELDAVNHILVNAGNAAVTTLSGTLPIAVEEALRYLSESVEILLSRGWYWNKEVRTISPNGSQNIPLPPETLAVVAVGDSTVYTMRSGLLYRLKAGSNGSTFTSAVTLELTLGLPFTDLPQAARLYAMLNAARRYQAKDMGDSPTNTDNQYEESRAWAKLRADDNKYSHRTLKTALSVQGISG